MRKHLINERFFDKWLLEMAYILGFWFADGYMRKKVCSFNNGSSWKLGYETLDTIKLLKFMYYPNFPIGLERKAKFIREISYMPR